MSDQAPLAPVADPDLRALLDNFKTEIFASLNCHQWGVIQSFNAAKQTAVVQIAMLRQVPQAGAYVSKACPLLLDVPVFVPAGGTGFLSFPVAGGDLCLVLFNDRDMDTFWATGNVAVPNSARMHDLSDGLAIVGFRTGANPLAGYDAAKVVLALATTRLTLGPKIRLENATTDLLTVLTNLITTLKTWVNTGGSTPNPATVTALTAIQTQLDTLLQ